MPEYIEREALIEQFESNGSYFTYGQNVVKAVISRIKVQPAADVVEVVRCKDCKHFCPYEGEEHKGDCAELVGLESCVYEDDFCSYGERKDGDEE